MIMVTRSLRVCVKLVIFVASEIIELQLYIETHTLTHAQRVD